MRYHFTSNDNTGIGLRANVIAGTRIVFFGYNVNDTSGLLGFSVERFNPASQERKMMQGYKIFPSTGRGIKKGTPVDSDKHPIQSFQWSDYGCIPNTTYEYTITAHGGTPKNLTKLDQLHFTVTTMSEDINDYPNGSHVAIFNSGVAGSQAFSNRFPEVTRLSNSEDPAVWKWLSRGLKESIENFIRSAEDSTYALYGAFYEFFQEDILNEFKLAAEERKVDVRLVVSWKDNPKKNKNGTYDEPAPREANRQALQNIGVADPESCDWIIPRTSNSSYLQHNKFLILLQNGKPIRLLTGSTNITDSGIYGQSNVVHINSDPALANRYYEYWEQLTSDPGRSDLSGWIDNNNPLPNAKKLPVGSHLIFSPRTDEAALELYAELIAQTENAAFITQAFSINKKFVEVLSQDLEALRFVLLDKLDGRFESDYQLISSDYDVELAVGSNLPNGAFQRWIREINNDISSFVDYIHLKVIVIDPIGDNPVVITGSANYSVNSTKNNDENTLLIKGDKNIADIYLGELFRLFNHHYFRYLQNKIQDTDADSTPKSKVALLAEKPEEWVAKYDASWTTKYKKRYYFCP